MPIKLLFLTELHKSETLLTYTILCLIDFAVSKNYLDKIIALLILVLHSRSLRLFTYHVLVQYYINMKKMSECLTRKEAIGLLKVFENTPRNWDSEGRIKAIRIGGCNIRHREAAK